MSDIVYKNNNLIPTFNRYQSNFITDPKNSLQPSKEGYRMELMFPVIRKEIKNPKKAEKEDMQIVMVMGGKNQK